MINNCPSFKHIENEFYLLKTTHGHQEVTDIELEKLIRNTNKPVVKCPGLRSTYCDMEAMRFLKYTNLTQTDSAWEHIFWEKYHECLCRMS